MYNICCGIRNDMLKKTNHEAAISLYCEWINVVFISIPVFRLHVEAAFATSVYRGSNVIHWADLGKKSAPGHTGTSTTP